MSRMFIILFLFGFLLALLIYFLVLPFELSFRVEMKGALAEQEYRVRGFLGLIGASLASGPEVRTPTLFLFGIPLYRRERREEVSRGGVDWHLLFERRDLIKELSSPFVEFVRTVIHHLSLRNMDCQLEIGLPDPVDTAMMCGVLCPLSSIIQPFLPNATFVVIPVFVEEIFNLSVRGSLSLRIVSILVPSMRILTKKEFRELRKTS